MREANLRALHGYRTRRWALGKPSVELRIGPTPIVRRSAGLSHPAIIKALCR